MPFGRVAGYKDDLKRWAVAQSQKANAAKALQAAARAKYYQKLLALKKSKTAGLDLLVWGRGGGQPSLEGPPLLGLCLSSSGGK